MKWNPFVLFARPFHSQACDIELRGGFSGTRGVRGGADRRAWLGLHPATWRRAATVICRKSNPVPAAKVAVHDRRTSVAPRCRRGGANGHADLET